MKCRFCKEALTDVFIDLYNSPASNSFLKGTQLNEAETFFPLKVFTCRRCFLVQVDEYKDSEAIFDADYVYFSSFSTSWLAHAKNYVEMMIGRFSFDRQSQVIEIASNDGYLLQYFKERMIPVLGIEPTANTAAAAREKGIESVVDFFGTKLASRLASEGMQADLLLGNNVLAHVPDIVDFTRGLPLILKPTGIVTMEFPHLVQLIANNQFDTIYHEHFSYLSFTTVSAIFYAAGLEMFDVEEIPTHGGSLRVFAKHIADKTHQVTTTVTELLARESSLGISDPAYYTGFQQRALKIKFDLLGFLLEQKRNNRRVAAYGAAAKGNTLLNFCGIKNDLIEYVVDLNPHKQGKFLPASHIPVVDEAWLKEHRPDFIIIFPWNIREEVMTQLHYVREWGAQFVTNIPEFQLS